MKESLVQGVKEFLSKNWVEKKPVCLGFSGGVDSSALLSVLVECRRFFPLLDLHVCHFDHAWRPESREEAKIIKNKMGDLGFSFYSERSVFQGEESGNKEERAREERYAFFLRVYREIGAQALLLAHQREDQAETVLKRILEGSGILHLGGMSSVSFYEEMVLWRPLLPYSRKALLAWNQEKGVEYFLDYTNEDLQFLRPRMRRKIFPELEKWFGKQVQKNLFSLGEEFQELKKDLLAKMKQWESFVVEGPLGFFLPLRELPQATRLERQELIRFCLKKRGVFLHREKAKTLELLASSEALDKGVDVELGDLFVDRGNVYWVCPPSAFLWTEEGRGGVDKESWLSLFLRGEVLCEVGEGGATVETYDSLQASEKKRVSSIFSKQKIPSRIKKLFPFVIRNGTVSSFYFCSEIKDEEQSCDLFLRMKLKKI